MSQTEMNIVLGVVFAIGALWQAKNMLPSLGGLVGKVKAMVSKTVVVDEETGEVKASSDSPPPAGFAEHIAVIRSASHAASADVRETYYEKGLTFAETLQAEYDRVTKKTEKTEKPEVK
jgi:hypothetical protein